MKVEKVSRVRAHTQYRLKDGTRVPGVTTIIDVLNKGRALLIWANNIGLQGIEMSKYVDKLADAGTLAHQMIAHDMGGAEPEWDSFTQEQRSLAENAFLKFLYWRDQHRIEPYFVERPLVSEKYRFGGTIDCYAEIDGKSTVLDIKTSRGVYDEHFLQVSAYRHLLQECGYAVAAVKILRVGRTEDEGFEEHSLSDVAASDAWEIFRNCLEIYRLKRTWRKGRA